MMKIKILLLGLVLSLSGAVSAATFNLFTPATGVLKGNTNSYVTTAATASDILGLWSGSCSSTTFLRGDGSCQTTGATAVTSVGLTAPSVFSVTGSPVTTTGTLALVFANGQTQNRVLASPNGSSGAVALRALVAADLPSVSLTAGVTGTLPVANGGTGAVTLTGPLKGNGTAALSAAAASDIYGLWSGTCNGSTFLRGDGSCTSVSAVPAGADTQLQYNNAGSLGASSSLTWNNSTSAFTVAGTSISLTGSFGTKLNFISGTPTLEGGGSVFINAGTLGSGDLNIGTTGAVIMTTNGTVTIDGSSVCRANGTGCPTGGSPGGSTTQVQYNNAGSLGGDAGMTYNAGTDTLTVGSIIGNGSGLSSLDAGDISAGTLPVARGGTGTTTSTGSGNTVLSASPTLTGTATAATVAATTVTVGGVNVCLTDGTSCSFALSAATERVARAQISTSSGGCTVNSGSRNVSSCSRSGVGQYLVTVAAGFTTSFQTCVVSPGGDGRASDSIASLTSVSVLTWNASNALSDAPSFNLICFGT